MVVTEGVLLMGPPLGHQHLVRRSRVMGRRIDGREEGLELEVDTDGVWLKCLHPPGFTRTPTGAS